ncbi:hypothetical protein NBE98_18385 [Clostridium swellfunianum]|nr:hypothetical protein [Clostridium swellfunianum]MCM0650336.1 hypothetical protein [Clostridium swellfunianum]
MARTELLEYDIALSEKYWGMEIGRNLMEATETDMLWHYYFNNMEMS